MNIIKPISHWKGHILAAMLIFTFSSYYSSEILAQEENEIFVLHDISIPDSYNAPEGTKINLIIRDGILDLITEDPIPEEDGSVNFDARGGIIVGDVELGLPASFFIINENVSISDAMQDTKVHARFIMVQGDVVKNNLSRFSDNSTPEMKIEEERWFAYTPPPRISRTTEANRDNWNRFNTKHSDGVVFGALLLDRQKWTTQDTGSESLVGDLNNFSGGQIRGFRVGAVGTIKAFESPWTWTVSGATHSFDKGFDQNNTDDFSFLDVRLDIPLKNDMTLSLGKQREPISMERIMTLVDNPMQERTTVSDGFLPSRNTGAVLTGTAFNQRVSLAGGIFNNFLDKDQPGSPGDNSTQYVARATWLAYASPNDSAIFHLGAAIRGSNMKQGGALFTEPEFNNSPKFLDTDFFNAESQQTRQFEASFRTGPFWLHGEHVSMEVDEPSLQNPEFSGYHLTFSWIATGEMRTYRRRNGAFSGVPISRDVNHNGMGALEFSTRFSHSDFTDGLVEGGEADIWSIGVNWWASSTMNINFNYRFIDHQRGGIGGDVEGFNTRILLVLN